MLSALAFLLAGLVAQEQSQKETATAEITNGRFTVTVNDYGVLVGVPLQGLRPGEGRGALLLYGFAEWFSLLYEGPQGQSEFVGLGSAPDWAGRTAVERVSFGASRDGAVAITRTPDLLIRTTFCFEGVGDYLVVFTDVKSLSDAPLRNILFSREWRPTKGAGWNYPEDLVPPRAAPPDVCRVVRMPDDLQPNAAQCITHYYALNQNQKKRADDVPLVLWTSPTFPLGLTVADTNGVSWGDYDADRWPDFFVCESAELWHNEQGLNWRLAVDLDSVLPTAGLRYGSAFGDYDNDGLPDIAIEPRNAGLDQDFHLLRNLGGGSFEDVAVDPAIVDVLPFGDSETACWVDVDADQDLDLFVPVYPQWAFGPGNFFLDNLGASGPRGAYRFHESSAQAGLDNPPPDSARPEGAEFCDVDFDGDPDHYSGGTLFQNVSDPGAPLLRAMTEAASGIDFHEDYDEGCGFLDFDMDGDWDLAVAYCVGGHGIQIWENRGDGTFFPAGSIIDDPNTGLCLGFSKCDWDMDGDVDITSKEVFRRNLLVETGDRHFTVATHSIPPDHLTSAQPAWADWDKDGDPDCLLGNHLFDGHLYENDTYQPTTPLGAKRNVSVRVVRDSNAVLAGLDTEYGAAVEIQVLGEEGRRKRKQLVTSSGGYLCQNEYDVLFALPADPAPADPNEDVHFDVSVDFPCDPAGGMVRVDRSVNPELGDLNLARLVDREISVYRSGRVVINGCAFAPFAAVETSMTTTMGGLALPTDTVGLPDPLPSPANDWYVGIDFETDANAGPQLIKEVIVDGVLDGAVGCGGGAEFNVALWDVTRPGNPAMVDGGTSWTRRRLRNHRSYLPTRIRVEAGRHYRLVARVVELRASPISSPVVDGAVTTLGGLSFQDTNSCDGLAIANASVDPSSAYVAFRFAEPPSSLWTDLGFSLSGTLAAAQLHGSGDMQPGIPITLRLTNSLPSSLTVLIAGVAPACRPFKGGTLVPQLDLMLVLTSDAQGAWTLNVPWPSGVPECTTIYCQAWFPDPAAPRGLAASNAVSGTTDL